MNNQVDVIPMVIVYAMPEARKNLVYNKPSRVQTTQDKFTLYVIFRAVVYRTIPMNGIVIIIITILKL